VREALFNVLAPRLAGSSFLDAYAGTGAVGIEALSRGAERAVFVESDGRAAHVLEENLRTLDVMSMAEVLVLPFARAASGLASRSACFDIVFLDPPYGPGELLRSLRLCASMTLLRASGILVAEHDSRLSMPEQEGSLSHQRSLRYGGTTLSFFGRG
jgi:16S rRNA (guanine(966)-N(2))-methyltransferase RsmD